MRIYLDVSCLNRPADDQQQPRIRLETEAILLILDRIELGQWVHVASEIVVIEIEATSDADRRRRMQALLPDSGKIASLTGRIWSRAKECEKLGFGAADAVHVAAAEALQADVLLSCDDRMCRIGSRNRSKLLVRIDNPLSWLKKVEP